ncbi:hypothetical protein [Daejeonella sp.]|uniref:hypothetical protein n=1 Tax=Daejeonella sp. TaxID=2805397 RepID=UPI0039835D3A
MKSNYTYTRPLMKMSSEMMSSRPKHETPGPASVIAKTISLDKGSRENKGYKK